MTFQLDTSGEVALSLSDGVPWEIAGGHRWSDLSPFAQGYVEALFAALDADMKHDAGNYYGGDTNAEYLGECPTFYWLAPETLARIIADCGRCEDGYRKLGIQNVHIWSGYNVWLLQQAGSLVEHGFPPLTVQLGGDGKVRFVQ